MPQPTSGVRASTPFWSIAADQLLAELGTDPQRGLGEAEAAARLARQGPDRLVERQRGDVPVLLLRQFSSPIVMILIVLAYGASAELAKRWFYRNPTPAPSS